MRKKKRGNFRVPTGTVTPNMAGKIAGVTGECVKQWIYDGKLIAAKLPNGYYLIREADLQAYIKTRTDTSHLDFKLHGGKRK